MSTLLVSHDDCLNHEPGSEPETPARLRAILAALAAPEFGDLKREAAPRLDPDQLLSIHSREHIDRIRRTCPETGIASLDYDTHLSPGSWEAALRAAGAGVRAVDAVLGGAATNAFCAIRPPGHHATTDRAMGFCLFNNAAMAARHARQAHGLGKVAIVDFDVHHGNGTQEIFWRDPSVLYASTHQMPHYPGSGAASETGAGNIVNVPLAAGDGSGAFDAAIKSVILPALERFEPELVIVSAGFDAHRADPLSSTLLEEEDYSRATRQLCAIAAKYADGRLVSLLEGGYHLQALASSAAAHVRALMQA